MYWRIIFVRCSFSSSKVASEGTRVSQTFRDIGKLYNINREQG